MTFTSPFLLENKNNLYSKKDLSILFAEDSKSGVLLANNFLKEIIDKKTAFFLSGGRTPKDLYSFIAKEKTITPGALGLVDERYGKPFHKNSNELMIREASMLSYIEERNVRFYPILKEGLSREETAIEYDKDVRLLLSTFPKSVAILGVGIDGHTGGIPAKSKNLESQISIYTTSDLVTSYDDRDGFYKERVTMTFEALARIDVLLILVFGEDKKEALEKMFTDGSVEDVPSRFLVREQIAKKSLLITDQKI